MVSRRKRIAQKERASDLLPSVDDASYQAWLAHAFDRPITPNGWYFDLDQSEFEATPAQEVELFARTMRNAGTDLAAFSDAQVRYGLNYIFSGSCSDFIHAFSNGEVPLARRIDAIRAMKHLYKDCFEPRCAPVLGHLSEKTDNPLWYIVYMLWDETPIPWFGRSIPSWTDAVIDVLEYALASNNDACIESALHGLGHMKFDAPVEVERAIDRFLATTCDAQATIGKFKAHGGLRPLRKELREYARKARTGCIQ